jgi:uncharacterized protein YdaU (DUF1376 family)
MAQRFDWPFKPADYHRDTGHLTTTQHGAYLLLLIHYWVHGKLPTDETQIRRITKIPAGKVWRQTRPVLAAFFTADWKHKRVENDLKKYGAFTAKMRAAAKRRWEKRPVDKRATAVGGRSGLNPLIEKGAANGKAVLFLKEDKSSLKSTNPRVVEKGPTEEASKKNAAQAKWESDLRRYTGPNYSEAIDLLAAQPGLIEACTAAEMDEPGAGLSTAAKALQRVLP